MKFLNDEYTLDIEQLADKNQINKIRELILDAPTPFSIGISGRWGSGKTSIMKYLMASLGGEPISHQLNSKSNENEEKEDFHKIFKKFYSNQSERKKFKNKNLHAIWFNPWENESHHEPMVGLLHAITHHFSFFEYTIQKGGKLASVSIQSSLDMLGSLTKLGKNVGTNIKNIGEKYEHENFQYIDRSQRFKFVFHEAIEKLLQVGMDTIDDDARIVIFIDDLDRCEDETIEKLLKEIKQYLSTKRCIFVFGYDRHHIEKSISSVSTKSSKETRAYLEKLFQATFYLKESNSENLEKFILKTVKNYSFVNRSEQKEFTTFIASIIDSNPRRIKTFLMAIYFHISSSSDFGSSSSITLINLKKLALITYLKLFYESVYAALENQPFLLKDLWNVCKERRVVDALNQREYFFYLEFKSHLHSIDTIKRDDIESSKEYENKFVAEVSEMQGKHKSFENYMNQVVELFESEPSIEKYL